MKKVEMVVGKTYEAKVNGKVQTVRLDSMGLGGFGSRQHTTYWVTNLGTGRKTMFRSAAKFVRPSPALRFEESI